MPRPRPLRALCAALCLSSVASAQIYWLTFHEDNSLLVASNGLGLGDTEEKDYAWADLDKDGWSDLAVVRKQPFTTSGRRENVLFMNEGGVLVDRTSAYASSSDVGGDAGFLTPTNDRDVVTVDVDLDGWLDVVTVTTISPGQPKSVSHPRVYRNLGDDGGGNWLGLHYEEARTPDFGTFPNFCAVAAGDVTGDGYPDLYFAHYHQSADVDLDDRLLVNDGTGHFNDESSSRMTSSMLASSFGTAAVIADMNGDGHNDIVKDTALGSTGASGPRITLSYNDPGSVGTFNILQTPFSGAPYHVNSGDLNQDGKLDLVITDDGADRYMLNQGNDGLGRVQWSSAYTFPSGDDGFGSNNMIVDVDGDGWEDILIADVDVDISGCSRRLHLYHNQGGTVGGFVTLTEESGSGWRGAEGLTSTELRGTHDFAVFDLDNDGDLDLVLGQCSGTSVWINDQTLDCNGNGIGDSDDIANGTSDDCNANGIPDECEADCDGDGVPDDCETDCNANGTPDDCETFTDCDANGVPDECDADCDADGLPDACEADCNANGTPDDCESFTDCDANGVPDECQADCDADGLPDACETDCNANGTPDDCESFTDCDANGVPDECQADCDTDGLPDACETDCNANGTPDDCESFTDCDANGVPDECQPDCDADGLPDDCETDCNANGTPDDCESFTDCDANGVPDECQPDCDADGLPDACETDCNANGTPDDCESFSDCNANGIPDDCEADCDADGLPDDCEVDCNANGTPDDCETFDDCDANGVPDECDPDSDGDGTPDACELGTNYCGPAVLNSSGKSAVMDATGSNVVADNDLTLHALDLPTNKFGYFLVSETQGFVAQPPGSQGNLCLSGAIGRYALFVQNSGAAGEFSMQVDLTLLPKPLNVPVLPGETWNWQAWFRDVNPTQTSNFTDGLSITFQ